MPFQILSTLREGTGAPAKVGDKLVVHYKGTLADGGAVFDDSRERGHAFTFALGCNKVIRGWDEALRTMSLGERVSISIGPKWAYRKAGISDEHGQYVVPPNATLVFEMQLVGVKDVKLQDDSINWNAR